jgi:hypothetical protein
MNEMVVDLLRRLLDRAERGEIVAISVATLSPDLERGSAHEVGDISLTENQSWWLGLAKPNDGSA